MKSLKSKNKKLRLAELLGALSIALDMTEGQPPGHCVRCCWIGLHIGREAGMSEEDLSDLYYTLLLKDLGCSSNAARICELYVTDDISFKRDFKNIDDSMSQALKFVITHTGLQAGLAERLRAIVKIMQNGGDIARELIETRCHRGADIARQMRFSEQVARGIQCLDEHWNGNGQPSKISGEDIPLNSRIALLSQVIDVFNRTNGQEAAIKEVISRSGVWFDPNLVSCFTKIADKPDFWNELNAEDLEQKVYALEPAQCIRHVDDYYLDDIAQAFATVIDSKSPFTSGHSERVTVFTDMIAAEFGFSAEHRRWLKRAALLHDIGKLGISNSVLDKPGKLDEEEFAMIKMHPVYSESILNKLEIFADIAPIAGGHHERLDGKGYPRGLKGDEIGLDTRIVTVADIFDALTADRPYRKAMPVSKALKIMAEDVGAAIDEDCFEALQSALSRSDEDAISSIEAIRDSN